MVSQPRRDPRTDPLLTPENCALLLLDYQEPRIRMLRSIDADRLIPNVVVLADTARHFALPSMLATMGVNDRMQPDTLEAIRSALPNARSIDRTSLNAWEDMDVLAAVKATGRRKLILGGLWTEACLALTALDALRDGFEVFVPVDAVGGTSVEAHNAGLARMFQLGAQPVSGLAVLCELQRDWNRAETLQGTLSIGRQQAGSWPANPMPRMPESDPQRKPET